MIAPLNSRQEYKHELLMYTRYDTYTPDERSMYDITIDLLTSNESITMHPDGIKSFAVYLIDNYSVGFFCGKGLVPNEIIIQHFLNHVLVDNQPYCAFGITLLMVHDLLTTEEHGRILKQPGRLHPELGIYSIITRLVTDGYDITKYDTIKDYFNDRIQPLLKKGTQA